MFMQNIQTLRNSIEIISNKFQENIKVKSFLICINPIAYRAAEIMPYLKYEELNKMGPYFFRDYFKIDKENEITTVPTIHDITNAMDYLINPLYKSNYFQLILDYNLKTNEETKLFRNFNLFFKDIYNSQVVKDY